MSAESESVDQAIDRQLNELLGQVVAEIPEPRVRLSVDATVGTPALAAMIARVLAAAGAHLSFEDDRAKSDYLSAFENRPLEGLHIHIGQLTWVRQEEAQRWGTKS